MVWQKFLWARFILMGYNNYEHFIDVDSDDILMETHNRACFDRLMQELYITFYYSLQEGPELKLLNINLIQS